MIFKGDRQLTPALTDILDDTTPKNNKTFSSNKINSENNILNTKIDSETTRATAKENELETTITNISTVTTGNISTGFQNNFVGHIYWTKVGKVVNLSVELNKRVNDLSSWTWHLLNTLPSNLRPKQRVVCMAFTDYTCNIPADGGGCVNNEIQVSTNGQIHINPRNNIGLLNGDFIFWNITFITN